MRRTPLLAAEVAVIVILAPALCPVVLADWSPNDPYKMDEPRLPDPTGWDIEIFTENNECADDWVCSETGFITDIHFWISFAQDGIHDIDTITTKIYSDSAGQPGTLLWSTSFDFSLGEFTVIPYGSGLQGFYAPHAPPALPQDHQFFQQVNIVDIEDPFEQMLGTTYWLGIFVDWGGTGALAPVGWKTSTHTGSNPAHYWTAAAGWLPLFDPLVPETPLHLAFVITSEPPGGPIPTLTEWGVFLLVAATGLAALWVLGHRRRAAHSPGRT